MFRKVKYWFRNIFGFSKTETNGAVAMIILMVPLFLLPPLLNYFEFSTYKFKDKDEELLERMLADFDQSTQAKEVADVVSVVPDYFSFDPNNVSEESLLSLGIAKNLATRIINFRNKGGQFSIKSDLLKVYGFPTEKYKELYPYIDLPEKKVAASSKPSRTVANISGDTRTRNKTTEIFDINQADTAQLKSMKGIGSVLSARIIKYRNSLGGFVSKDQYREIYGLDDQVVQQLQVATTISEGFEPTKININQAGVEELSAHPYISKKLANRIVSYRDHHGFFVEEELLNGIRELDEGTKEKLYPYLEF